jgi:hypothetical protein
LLKFILAHSLEKNPKFKKKIIAIFPSEPEMMSIHEEIYSLVDSGECEIMVIIPLENLELFSLPSSSASEHYLLSPNEKIALLNTNFLHQ